MQKRTKAWLEVAAISETVDLEKAIIFVVARFMSRQMKSRCKTLHIDLQLETLALPEKERSEERGALFRPLFNGGRGGGGLSLSRFASVLRFCLHARCTSAAGRGGLAP